MIRVVEKPRLEDGPRSLWPNPFARYALEYPPPSRFAVKNHVRQTTDNTNNMIMIWSDS